MKNRNPWTQQEIDILIRDYPNTRTEAIAKQLCRSAQSVYSKAAGLGIRKSADYLNSASSGRLQPGDNTGISTRFKPGNKPHNYGIKGWQAGGNANKTRFKAGGKPHNWVPVGSERKTKDGYLQRKMTDTGYPPRDWVSVHQLVWEEHHGAIPAGHIVIFKNGNQEQISIDNLKLISRTQNMQRNSVHRLPKPLAKLCQLKGALQRQINRREHERQN